MPNPDRWARVEELFNAAVQFDGQDRRAYLESACAGDAELRAEVEALLRAERGASGDDFITRAVEAAVEEVAALASSSWVGRSVGPYRLRGELGSGGMGIIYLAERADAAYEAQVAIKFIRGGGAELGRRFRAERQILADLSHPNIARLLDGGTTDDGLPYLVMERIEGEPIDEYCDRHGLGLRDRLRLFLRVCDAVDHAHRHLVVHRDIKPSNILVTADGDPKLLDFGVAKLIEPTGSEAGTGTATAGRMLTPAFASPEQVSGGPITTATDVYSLGVLLYRLLTGRLPFDVGALRPHELAQAILEQDPQPPGRVLTRVDEKGGPGARIGRDVDAIVLTALQKEPGRRYRSVERFADDIRRYLAGLPVRAQPPTPTYRAWKFAARNRRAVLVAAGAVVLLVGLTGFHMTRLARERDFADAEGRKAAQVAGFLEGLFHVSDPSEARGRTITAREVVDSAAARLPIELAGQPAVQAAMLYTLGGVYQGLGLGREALPLLERGLALRREDPAGGAPTVGDFLARIGSGHMDLGRFDSATAVLTEAVRRLSLEYPHGNEATGARLSLAHAHRRAGRLEEADSVLERAVAGARTSSDDSILALALSARASVYLSQRRPVEAEGPAREAWERRRDLFGADAPNTIAALGALGQALYQQSRLEEAEPIVREVLELSRRVRGERHGLTGTAWNNLAALLQAQGRHAEAAEAGRQALDIYRAAYGERHQRVTLAMTNLASMLLAAGDAAEAERLHRDALRIKLDVLAPGHADIAVSHNNLAHVLEQTGRYGEAERSYRGALQSIGRGLGVESELGSIFLANLGRVLERQERFEESEATLRRALALQRELLPAQHARTATTLTLVGGLLVRTDRAEEAEPLIRESLQMRVALFDADHWAIQASRSLLGEAAAALGEPEAEELLTSSAEALRTRFGPDDERARTAIGRAVAFYEGRGDEARARQFRVLLEP